MHFWRPWVAVGISLCLVVSGILPPNPTYASSTPNFSNTFHDARCSAEALALHPLMIRLHDPGRSRWRRQRAAQLLEMGKAWRSRVARVNPLWISVGIVTLTLLKHIWISTVHPISAFGFSNEFGVLAAALPPLTKGHQDPAVTVSGAEKKRILELVGDVEVRNRVLDPYSDYQTLTTTNRGAAENKEWVHQHLTHPNELWSVAYYYYPFAMGRCAFNHPIRHGYQLLNSHRQRIVLGPEEADSSYGAALKQADLHDAETQFEDSCRTANGEWLDWQDLSPLRFRQNVEKLLHHRFITVDAETLAEFKGLVQIALIDGYFSKVKIFDQHVRVGDTWHALSPLGLSRVMAAMDDLAQANQLQTIVRKMPRTPYQMLRLWIASAIRRSRQDDFTGWDRIARPYSAALESIATWPILLAMWCRVLSYFYLYTMKTGLSSSDFRTFAFVGPGPAAEIRTMFRLRHLFDAVGIPMTDCSFTMIEASEEMATEGQHAVRGIEKILGEHLHTTWHVDNALKGLQSLEDNSQHFLQTGIVGSIGNEPERLREKALFFTELNRVLCRWGILVLTVRSEAVPEELVRQLAAFKFEALSVRPDMGTTSSFLSRLNPTEEQTESLKRHLRGSSYVIAFKMENLTQLEADALIANPTVLEALHYSDVNPPTRTRAHGPRQHAAPRSVSLAPLPYESLTLNDLPIDETLLANAQAADQRPALLAKLARREHYRPMLQVLQNANRRSYERNLKSPEQEAQFLDAIAENPIPNAISKKLAKCGLSSVNPESLLAAVRRASISSPVVAGDDDQAWLNTLSDFLSASYSANRFDRAGWTTATEAIEHRFRRIPVSVQRLAQELATPPFDSLDLFLPFVRMLNRDVLIPEGILVAPTFQDRKPFAIGRIDRKTLVRYETPAPVHRYASMNLLGVLTGAPSNEPQFSDGENVAWSRQGVQAPAQFLSHLAGLASRALRNIKAGLTVDLSQSDAEMLLKLKEWGYSDLGAAQPDGVLLDSKKTKHLLDVAIHAWTKTENADVPLVPGGPADRVYQQAYPEALRRGTAEVMTIKRAFQGVLALLSTMRDSPHPRLELALFISKGLAPLIAAAPSVFSSDERLLLRLLMVHWFPGRDVNAADEQNVEHVKRAVQKLLTDSRSNRDARDMLSDVGEDNFLFVARAPREGGSITLERRPLGSEALTTYQINQVKSLIESFYVLPLSITPTLDELNRILAPGWGQMPPLIRDAARATTWSASPVVLRSQIGQLISDLNERYLQLHGYCAIPLQSPDPSNLLSFQIMIGQLTTARRRYTTDTGDTIEVLVFRRVRSQTPMQHLSLEHGSSTYLYAPHWRLTSENAAQTLTELPLETARRRMPRDQVTENKTAATALMETEKQWLVKAFGAQTSVEKILTEHLQLEMIRFGLAKAATLASYRLINAESPDSEKRRRWLASAPEGREILMPYLEAILSPGGFAAEMYAQALRTNKNIDDQGLYATAFFSAWLNLITLMNSEKPSQGLVWTFSTPTRLGTVQNAFSAPADRTFLYLLYMNLHGFVPIETFLDMRVEGDAFQTFSKKLSESTEGYLQRLMEDTVAQNFNTALRIGSEDRIISENVAQKGMRLSLRLAELLTLTIKMNLESPEGLKHLSSVEAILAQNGFALPPRVQQAIARLHTEPFGQRESEWIAIIRDLNDHYWHPNGLHLVAQKGSSKALRWDVALVEIENRTPVEVVAPGGHSWISRHAMRRQLLVDGQLLSSHFAPATGIVVNADLAQTEEKSLAMRVSEMEKIASSTNDPAVHDMASQSRQWFLRAQSAGRRRGDESGSLNQFYASLLAGVHVLSGLQDTLWPNDVGAELNQSDGRAEFLSQLGVVEHLLRRENVFYVTAHRKDPLEKVSVLANRLEVGAIFEIYCSLNAIAHPEVAGPFIAQAFIPFFFDALQGSATLKYRDALWLTTLLERLGMLSAEHYQRLFNSDPKSILAAGQNLLMLPTEAISAAASSVLSAHFIARVFVTPERIFLWKESSSNVRLLSAA